MDQDFHYYGTYYAAGIAGWDQGAATRIAKAANFIDFLHEGAYAGYWQLVRERSKSAGYSVIADVNNPRYTFQAGKLSAGVAPEDGLWCSYHFTPGNYDHDSADNGFAKKEAIYGIEVADTLPEFVVRDIKPRLRDKAKLLNRPQSQLSHALATDAILCATDNTRLEDILMRAQGGWEALRAPNKADCIERFRQLLLGVRAHVIADTWAHQDFAGISHDINIYFDIDGSSGRQAIKYVDSTGEHKVVLSATSHENLQAVPNGTSYLGHGWMGHFPDYSFAKFTYKPRWRQQGDEPLVRDNPKEYWNALLELCGLFAKARGSTFSIRANESKLVAARTAFSTPCEIANSSVCPRQFSSVQWQTQMRKVNLAPPENADLIDAKAEPDSKAVLAGLVETSVGTGPTRYGTITVNATSDLYLFQIAVDYHFHFVKHWLKTKGIMEFTGSWSQKTGPLSPMVTDLFTV